MSPDRTRLPLNDALQADHQQLEPIDLDCSLAAYCVGRVASGQRCCWPLNADLLGGVRSGRARWCAEVAGPVAVASQDPALEGLAAGRPLRLGWQPCHSPTSAVPFRPTVPRERRRCRAMQPCLPRSNAPCRLVSLGGEVAGPACADAAALFSQPAATPPNKGLQLTTNSPFQNGAW